LFVKLVIYKDYTEMQDQQNIKAVVVKSHSLHVILHISYILMLYDVRSHNHTHILMV